MKIERHRTVRTIVNGYEPYPWRYPQVLQLEDEQESQELLPPIGIETPPASFEKEAKVEMIFLAAWSHLGQTTSSSALSKESNTSKWLLQFVQLYS